MKRREHAQHDSEHRRHAPTATGQSERRNADRRAAPARMVREIPVGGGSLHGGEGRGHPPEGRKIRAVSAPSARTSGAIRTGSPTARSTPVPRQPVQIPTAGTRWWRSGSRAARTPSRSRSTKARYHDVAPTPKRDTRSSCVGSRGHLWQVPAPAQTGQLGGNVSEPAQRRAASPQPEQSRVARGTCGYDVAMDGAARGRGPRGRRGGGGRGAGAVRGR